MNIAGAAATSLVAALKRWRQARKAFLATASEVLAAVEAVEASVAAVATERTALLARRARSSSSIKRAGEKRGVRFDAHLIDVSSKDDQAQIAILHPIS